MTNKTMDEDRRQKSFIPSTEIPWRGKLWLSSGVRTKASDRLAFREEEAKHVTKCDACHRMCVRARDFFWAEQLTSCAAKKKR